jgi:hypothetical protein
VQATNAIAARTMAKKKYPRHGAHRLGLAGDRRDRRDALCPAD